MLKNTNTEIITYNDEEEREYYHNTFTLEVEIQPNDAIAATRFMEIELAAYNHVVSILSAQFIRDYKFFLDLPDDVSFIFGQMCMYGLDLYDSKKSNIIPDTLIPHKESIEKLSNNVKFILSEISKKMPSILPDIKKRMAVSILNFYIEQSKIRNKNTIMSTTDDEIRYTAAYDNLTPQTSFNKKHLQISRKDVKIVDKGNFCLLFIPYLKKPLKIHTDNRAIHIADWNYMVLKQKDTITSSKSPWIINFKRFEKNFYLYKFLDRKGKSGIFEMGKRLH